VKTVARILVAYIAVSQGVLTADYCARWIGSFLSCPPGEDCSIVVACNGGPLPFETAMMFEPLNAKFLPRVNDGGYDLSAYHEIAETMPCDLLVCQGESVYYHRPGWLRKIVEAWTTYGAGMYGMFSSYLVRPHLNTTGFAITPTLLRDYPKPRDHEERYEEEHGVHSLWKHVQSLGLPTKLVTWDGCYDPPQWREPKNILWKGQQSNLLAFCSHSDRYNGADPATRKRWSAWADGNFKQPFLSLR
jgi:hypothetical protein